MSANDAATDPILGRDLLEADQHGEAEVDVDDEAILVNGVHQLPDGRIEISGEIQVSLSCGCDHIEYVDMIVRPHEVCDRHARKEPADVSVSP